MNANLYNIAEERARRDPDYYVKLLANHKGHIQRRKARRDAYYKEIARRDKLAKLTNGVRCVMAVVGAVAAVSFSLAYWMLYFH